MLISIDYSKPKLGSKAHKVYHPSIINLSINPRMVLIPLFYQTDGIYFTILQIKSCASTESPSLTLKVPTLPECVAEMTISYTESVSRPASRQETRHPE
jgi:hypothetical protein